jgi:ATP-dependent DNA helicase DinG
MSKTDDNQMVFPGIEPLSKEKEFEAIEEEDTRWDETASSEQTLIGKVDWNIIDVFGETGLLSNKFDGYQVRPSQVELASEVDAAMEGGHHLVAEAPTGLGKSLGYLIPAIKNAVTHGRRVVVCTANIALQEQLFYKDLPLLQEILPTKFKYTLVKGRNNYFCVRNREKLKEEFAQGSFGEAKKPGDIELEDLYPSMPDDLVELCKWSKETETGDKSDLRFEPDTETWNKVSVTADDCFGSGCPWKAECFAERAKKALQDMHVIVSNYHLLFAAVLMRMATDRDIVLPPFAYLICDEAHKVPEIARAFFGWTISTYRINRIIVQFNKRMHQARAGMTPDEYSLAEKRVGDVTVSLRRFEDVMRQVYGRSMGAVRIKDDRKVPFMSFSLEMIDLAASLKDIGNQLNQEAETECKKLSKNAREIGDQLKELSILDDPNGVYFIEKFGRSGSLRMCKRLMDVSKILWKELYSNTMSTIATSATMAIDGNCDYVKDEMGMRKSKDIVVDSPFDFRKQALLILSANAPDPKERDTYPDKVAKIIRVIIDQAKGRTLGLFTSYQVLKTVAEYLRSDDVKLEYQVLVQGEYPRRELIRMFKEDVSSVLLGVESFWAGVDVPGEALSCVVIDKIPFPAPGDPVLDAIQEAKGGFLESFFQVSVPRAVLQLRQGAGRLIRSVNDRGVLLVLDRRLITKGYGSTFINSLPPMRRADGLKRGEVKFWLEEK